ncbi:molybdopterin-dependent oxidoreductase [Microbacterium sp. W4I4]|uniref:molybdopterin-dependent oxidoreductase n=1 Tax=Microbacterium sp. W4I4 TaxID=3042295 RepID=UPI0027D8EB0F|nr:molybdopterin-dependent oxidoreductase [Microbacterium sp. W4I4]
MIVSARHDRAVVATPLTAAFAGVAAAVVGAGAGELVGALLAPASSPFAVVGGALIDAAPAWAKDTAIAWFGTSDKVALIIGIGIVLLLAAAAAGICEARWPRSGVIGFVVIGAGVGILALTRPEAGMLSWLPSVAAGAVAAIAVRMLVSRAAPPETSAHAGAPSRRQFLVWAGGTAAVGVAMALAGSVARAGSTVVASVRDAIRLPRAAKPAPAVPAGAALDVPGLAPLITPNDEFYRIDTALLVPSVDPADWKLRIHGMVAQEVTLTWDELLALPLTESAVTLSCVSNPVGGDLVGNAVWLGYPIRELLAKAQPTADADMVLSTSIDGFTAGTPIEALTDDRDALLAIGMNGEPLPLAHGFPVRMVVPGLYGYVSATKWVTELEVTRFDNARAYWTDRGWSERGPIKLQSRIDVPRHGRDVEAGESVIAGVAWQPRTGISGVEVQVDDGPWQKAEIAAAISADTWVQWRMPWQAQPGQHQIRCRAIGGDASTQTDQYAAPAPNGASGWHTITTTVG